MRHRVADSREGWAKAVEMLEAMAFRKARAARLVLDLSDIRRAGAPIRGMQGRPASGPVSLLRAFLNIRRHVIEPARRRGDDAAALGAGAAGRPPPVGRGAGRRRPARRADGDEVLARPRHAPLHPRQVRGRAVDGQPLGDGGSRSSGSASRGDRAGAGRGADARPAARHALAVFDEATRCAWINGEPGFINGDRWRTTAPAPPGTSRCTRMAATSAAAATRWTRPPACSPSCPAAPLRRAFRSPPTRAARSRCTSPAAIA